MVKFKFLAHLPVDHFAHHQRGIPHYPKLQHHGNLTVRLFSVISWTLVGGVLPLCREADRAMLEIELFDHLTVCKQMTDV